MAYHVCIIPDGNRRWAKENDVPKRKGHKTGFENAKDMVKDLDESEYDIDEVSVWGLSRDNAEKRSQREVDYLNDLFQNFRDLEKEFQKRGIQFHLKGDFDKVQDDTVEELKEMERNTSDNDGMVMNLLLGYDGKYDLVQAFEKLRVGTHPHAEVSEEDLERFLLIPEIDVVLGYGEDRSHLSHIANWQVGYSTIYFPKKNFPDAESSDIDEAIGKHKNRKKSRGA